MSGTLATLLPFIALLVIMYFLLIRPQKKREREINAMRSGVQVGDEIITIGGICGKIVKTKADSLVIQVGADKVKFEIMRWAVSKVVEEGKRRPAKTGAEEAEDEAEVEVKKKPRRMKKAAPVEEEPETAEKAAKAVEDETAEEASAEEVVAEEAEEKEEK